MNSHELAFSKELQVSPEEVSGVCPDLDLEVLVGEGAQLLPVEVPVGEVDRGPVEQVDELLQTC